MIQTIMADDVASSLYADANDEADRHRWIRSQEAGRDLGEEAVYDWVRRHWHDYLKARWLEHIQGSRFWIELERSTFGMLINELPNESMLDTILKRMRCGDENLDILVWATDNGIDTEPIHRILAVIDINRVRLFRFFARNKSYLNNP